MTTKKEPTVSDVLNNPNASTFSNYLASIRPSERKKKTRKTLKRASGKK